jgi:hypothetical protein
MPCPLIASTDGDVLRLLAGCDEAFPIATRWGITRGPPAYAVPAGPGGACGIGGVMIDRLSIRTRPPGWPVMYQTWGTLLFLHWPSAAEHLRPLIPPRLSLDTFEGRAWVSVTPFTM